VSTETMRGNQLRLYLSVMAYVLMSGLRRLGLKTTDMADAQALSGSKPKNLIHWRALPPPNFGSGASNRPRPR
jgi:hypothetical protein